MIFPFGNESYYVVSQTKKIMGDVNKDSGDLSESQRAFSSAIRSGEIADSRELWLYMVRMNEKNTRLTKFVVSLPSCLYYSDLE